MLPENANFLGRVSKSEQNRGMIFEKKKVFKKSPNFLTQSAYHLFIFLYVKIKAMVTAPKSTLTDFKKQKIVKLFKRIIQNKTIF